MAGGWGPGPPPAPRGGRRGGGRGPARAARWLKGGVIVEAGAPGRAEMAGGAGSRGGGAGEGVPGDIRREGGGGRMSGPGLGKGLKAAVTIPVMAKCRIGHFVEARILESL